MQTSAPSSITATAQVAAVGSSSAAATRRGRARPRCAEPAGSSTPLTARASTRRTLVSSTACRRPNAKDAMAARRVVADARAARSRSSYAVGHLAAVPLDDRGRAPRAAAAPGAGSRAGPRRGRPRRSARRRGRPASARCSARPSKTGSTRATGVCWSMNSETITAHGRGAGPRQGRSRACSSYQASSAAVHERDVHRRRTVGGAGVAPPPGRRRSLACSAWQSEAHRRAGCPRASTGSAGSRCSARLAAGVRGRAQLLGRRRRRRARLGLAGRCWSRQHARPPPAAVRPVRRSVAKGPSRARRAAQAAADPAGPAQRAVRRRRRPWRRRRRSPAGGSES